MKGLKPEEVIKARHMTRNIKDTPALITALRLEGSSPRNFSCQFSIPFLIAKNAKNAPTIIMAQKCAPGLNEGPSVFQENMLLR